MHTLADEYKSERYKKRSPIGAKGNLWIAEDSVTQKRCVMRRLPMHMQAVCQRLSAIRHAGVVEILDVFPYEGSLYVIEEYLEGTPLSDMADGKSLSKRQVMSIAKQLFSALSVLHGQNIVHRDIKPENMIIDPRGRVKLIDFGIARLFSEDKRGDTTVKGTKDYAPPEQYGFSQTDRRADIYSLGVTLNELAVGRLPEDKLCGGRLGVIIRRCIEFDPKKRYQDAAQALRHIKRLEWGSAPLILSCLLLLAAMAAVLILSNGTGRDKDKEPTGNETPPALPEPEERILSVQDPGQYPALLMTENKEYTLSSDLRCGLMLSAKAEKNKEQLSLDCTLSNGGHAVFRFDDVCADLYQKQGHENNIALEETTPEYEIVLDDIDENGALDLLITLAWRCRVDTPKPAERFFITEYSTMWVVYLAEDGRLVCSEPLYLNGCAPSLQTDSLLYDSDAMEWHAFYDGVWR